VALPNYSAAKNNDMIIAMLLKYLAGNAWSSGKTAWKSVCSEVSLNGLLQFFHRAVVRVVRISNFPPTRSVESCPNTTT